MFAGSLRFIRYLFLALLGICLVTVALANRGLVAVHLLPEDMAVFSGVRFGAELPLFLIIFAGILAGLLIGFVWEWFREAHQRAEAAAAKRELTRLKAEVARLGGSTSKPKDEVLALLETGTARR